MGRAFPGSPQITQEENVMNAHAMLGPVVALVLWTFVIWAWMYATRIPAISKARMRLDATAPRGEQMSKLPPEVRWKADNYNHLFEQPTLFSKPLRGMLSVAAAWLGVASGRQPSRSRRGSLQHLSAAALSPTASTAAWRECASSRSSTP